MADRPDTYVSIEFLRVEFYAPSKGPIETRNGGSGFRRMWLHELPLWLAEHPGVLIVAIRPVGPG